MEITGKTVLLTGGSKGLGKEICRRLLEHGANVCFTARGESDGKACEDEFKKQFGVDRVLFVKSDVSSLDDVKHSLDEATKRFGAIEIMINNAGVVNEFSYIDMIAVNLTGTYHCTLEALERMRKDKGGKGGVIINVSSDGGIYPAWFMPTYCGTKAGVVHFTRSMADSPHVTEMGVRFHVLCPPSMDTPMYANLTGNIYDDEALKAYDDKYGLVSVEDVAKATLKLITEGNNGDVMLVSKNKGITYSKTSYPE